MNCGQKNKISSQTNILKQKLKPDRRVNENTRNEKEFFEGKVVKRVFKTLKN